MLIAGRGEPGDVLLVHRLALRPETFDHSGHVDRVPGHHRVGHQVQAPRLVPQFLLLLLPERALVGEEQELPQAVEGLALVELAEDPPPVILALEVTEDEDRLDQAAVLLQGSGQAVLAGIRLKLADQQRRKLRGQETKRTCIAPRSSGREDSTA